MSYVNDEKKKGTGIYFSNRQVSWVLSGFILISFFIFIAGYFLGKKKANQTFYQKINQESFADRIYYSVCSMYERDELADGQKSTEEDDIGVSVDKGKIVVSGMCESEQKSTKEEVPIVAKGVVAEKKQQIDMKQAGEPKNIPHYYAELIGFGTLRAANRFAHRVNGLGFSVIVKRRKSKTAKGKVITWYQVITEKFDNKNDLIAFVDIIKDKERLKGIRIVQC